MSTWLAGQHSHAMWLVQEAASAMLRAGHQPGRGRRGDASTLRTHNKKQVTPHSPPNLPRDPEREMELIFWSARMEHATETHIDRLVAILLQD